MKKEDHRPEAGQGLPGSPFAALDPTAFPEREVPPQPIPAPAKIRTLERLVLRREKSGRGGKVVVVITGFSDSRLLSEVAEIALRLKRQCGCGGTTRGREIEIQGDQPGRVRAFLEGEGFRVVGP